MRVAHKGLLELLSQPPSKLSSRPSSTSAKMAVPDASTISPPSPVAFPWLDLAGCVLMLERHLLRPSTHHLYSLPLLTTSTTSTHYHLSLIHI